MQQVTDLDSLSAKKSLKVWVEKLLANLSQIKKQNLLFGLTQKL
jgi:hypothetical protein